MIRKASLKDIDRIGEIYAAARKFMRATGNPTQWLGGYPSREQSVDDIANDCLFVVERQAEVCGVFYFNRIIKTMNDMCNRVPHSIFIFNYITYS